MAVNRFGDELFAGAGFSSNEYACVGGRGALEDGVERPHRC